MGGGPRFPYPKWVWAPTGGWWCENPPNARRNFVLLFSLNLLLIGGTCYVSSTNERRLRTHPTIPLPSQRWCSWTEHDDPDYKRKLEAYKRNKKPLLERILP
ncbi:MAG: hypothetical protein ACYCT1_20580, partial [Steroidobacteraceae bacterium]